MRPSWFRSPRDIPGVAVAVGVRVGDAVAIGPAVDVEATLAVAVGRGDEGVGLALMLGDDVGVCVDSATVLDRV